MEAEIKQRFDTQLERASIAFGLGTESGLNEAEVHLNVARRIIDEARGKKEPSTEGNQP